MRPPGCTQKARGVPGGPEHYRPKPEGAPKCLCAGRRARAHRRAGVGAGFTVLPPGHVEAAHELGIEGVRGVEHGEAQDVGGVLHDPVQVQDGEVLGPRRGHEAGAGPPGAEAGGGCRGYAPWW